MSTTTNFNTEPYYDDFDAEKGFHRVLFKPEVAIQSREMTQLQTILQNQIERFGDNILVKGTIISGCSFVRLDNVGYVKILDLQTDGDPVSMSAYKNKRVRGKTTGVEGVVFETATGLETQSPNLNTVFVSYTKAGENGEKSISETETIDVLDDTGAVRYSITAAGTVESNSTGTPYIIKVSDGVIYQKGFFVGVDEQILVVDKYSDKPASALVGFETVESTVNSYQDQSLLDIAQGHPNQNAPGADRLKLTPVLVSKTQAEAESDENFLMIQKIQDGRVVRRNETTRYSEIFDEIRKRTSEESGDYTVSGLDIEIGENSANNSLLDVRINSGVSYVEGRRVELTDTFVLPIEKSFDFETEPQQNVSMNFGNYILVDEMMGSIPTNSISEISLHNVQANRVTAGSVGSKPSGQIGTAKVRSVVYESGTPGTSDARYRLYLFDIRMNNNNNFDLVRSVYYSGSDNAVADAVLTNGRLVISETSFGTMIFDVGETALRSIIPDTTDYVYRHVNTSLTADASNGQIVINLSGNNVWPYSTGPLNSTQRRDIIVASAETQSPYTNGQLIDIMNDATVTVNSPTTMTIELNSNPANDMDVSVTYNVKRTAARPSGKTLESVYVKIDTDTHPNGTSGSYSLGMPDVYEIENVWVGDEEFSESNPSYKSRFRLENGQTPNIYGLSEIVCGNLPGSKILVKAKVFRRLTTGSYAPGFFTVNSYPVDDSVSPGVNTIRTEDIPNFEGSNRVFDLRNCVDFRPSVSATATFAADAASASVNPSDAVSFGTGNVYTPAPNKTFEADYEFYVGRSDIVIVNGSGEFSVRRGEPAVSPKPPSEPNVGMVLTTIFVPPFPSLTKSYADRIGKSQYGVTLRKRDNQRYTMNDIGGIEKRIDRIEYYTALSALEQDTINMLISDDNGLDRFKNGIFVDNLSDLLSADVKNPAFGVSIDRSETTIRPRFNSVFLNLEPLDKDSWSNAALGDNLTTLEPSGESVLSSQTFATNTRSCVTDFYKFMGVTQLTPSYDSGYDTARAPDVSLDISETFTEFTDALSEFIPLSRSEVIGRSREEVGQATWRLGDSRLELVRETVRERTRTARSALNVGQGQTTKVGDFVTDVEFNPFMRPRNIVIDVYGLRPNTRHYFFFDTQDVNNRVARWKGNRRSSAFGSSIKSDGSGRIQAVFSLPAETFHVGERSMEIMDVSRYTDKDTSTSYSKTNYNAYNYTVTKAGMSTRMPDININRSVEVRDTFETSWRFRDPIAQTFFVEESDSDESVFVNKVQVAFSSKSGTNGVTLEIRETENGYPAGTTIPFARKFLTSNQVSTSQDGSVMTTFEFDNPIGLKTNREYSFVILPESNDPDYRVYVARTGNEDLATGTPINRDSASGILFTSTNNRAWTAHQDENIKYTVMRNTYATDAGEATFTNKKNEFLKVTEIDFGFEEGETVIALKGNEAGTVSLSEGSSTVSGSGTSFTSLEIGDYIGIETDTNDIEVHQITNINNDTTMTISPEATVTVTNKNFFKTVRSDLLFYKRNEDAKMVLENSTANLTTNIQVGDTLFGVDSHASCTVNEVGKQKISYMQNHIRRIETKNVGMTYQTVITDSAGSEHEVTAFVNDDMHMTNFEAVIKSRSLEVLEDGGNRSFKFKANMSTETQGSTPAIDHEASGILVFEYLVDEEQPTAYVSKDITLSSDLAADDLKVFLTGYRPPGTDIEVYVAFKNETDPRKLNDVVWSQMAKKDETDGFSSSTNRSDFREIEFRVNEANDVNINPDGYAKLNKDNEKIIRYRDPDGVTFDRYTKYKIKVVLKTSSYNRVPRVRDIRSIALT